MPRTLKSDARQPSYVESLDLVGARFGGRRKGPAALVPVAEREAPPGPCPPGDRVPVIRNDDLEFRHEAHRLADVFEDLDDRGQAWIDEDRKSVVVGKSVNTWV